MRGASARQGSCVFILILTVLLSAPASAFEFFDGRIQIHGFYESQIRSIMEDFDPQHDWDLTQWYTVLNLEIEADIAPDGIGPFDLVSGFLRFDIRYDCVWRRACGLARSADAYGDRAQNLPDRVTGRRRGGLNGHVEDFDTRRYAGVPRNRLGISNLPLYFVPTPDDPFTPPFNFRREVSQVFDVPGIDGFFGISGIDGFLGPNEFVPERSDDPAQVAFGALSNCRYGFQRLKGSNNGNGGRTLPWSFGGGECVRNTGLNIDQPNPFRGSFDFFGRQNSLSANGSTSAGAQAFYTGGDINTVAFTDLPTDADNDGNPDPPVLGVNSFPFGNDGFGDLPLRPAPQAAFTDNVDNSVARGLWLPSAANARQLRNDEYDNPDQSFRQRELEWNRGASQQETKELREAYLDLELFDSRLWIRGGKQQIVWGKTELFRTTDQFNPQDLALASLPSLEESRIALFALRAVWSFYDVGPFEDVRLELAANYDEFEPADLGRCGEPYSPLVVCDKTFGLQAHGLAGVAIAGEIRPDDPWDDLSGFEVGGRLEWRWDRFSFALTEFWGYNDTPYTDQIFRYSRNVDPFSGLPRNGMSNSPCRTPAFNAGVSRQDTANFINTAVEPGCLTATNALANHSVNQTTFHLVCSSSIGFTNLDRTVCGQSVFSSKNNLLSGTPAANPILEPTVGALLSNLVVGNSNAASIAIALAGTAFPSTLVPINQDPCDGFLADCATTATGAFDDVNTPAPDLTIPDIDTPNAVFAAGGALTFNQLLTQQQKALAGCGQFYGTNCEIDGIDLMNAEVSALMQSWVGIEGTGIDGVGLTGNTFENVPQPGTRRFRRFRGPVATRTFGSNSFILPGARGQNNLGNGADDDGFYNPGLDGCAGPDGGVSAPGCDAGEFAVLPDGTLSPAARPADAMNLQHPFAGSGPDRVLGTADDIPSQYQYFTNELAAVSWNAMMTTVALSIPDDNGVIEVDEFDETDPFRTDGCSFETPILCSAMAAFWAITGVQRNDVRAGGNGRFGRRDFIWHGGAEFALRYEKRNVLGLSMDVAEDITKTNWSFEFTWINDLPFTDNNQLDGISNGDTFNLTLSVDRPTFINFLNANRTFFFNSQWFFQYVSGHQSGFTSNGPWNTLMTLTGFTGYFQDRLLPTTTFVYDFQSNSGALLPSITYRFTENFSATFGLAGFWGRQQRVRTPITTASVIDRAGANAYNSFAENGLQVVRERDEIFLRIRYAF